jgi:TatA/E family protein of Tat protein translocase
MFRNFGFWELVLILGIALLFFGARRIPEIARSLGKAMREFRRARDEVEKGLGDAEDGPAALPPDKATPPAPPPTGGKPDAP